MPATALLAERPPLLVFSDPWGRHPSSCQHLVRYLLGRYQIIWVELIGVRRWRCDRATWRRGLEQLHRWWCNDKAGAANQQAPQVLRPCLWPSFRNRWLCQLNYWQIRRMLPRFTRPPVVVTTLPVVAGMVGTFRARRWIYYCPDDYSVWPGWDNHTLRRWERLLLARIDRLIVVNSLLLDKFNPLFTGPTLLLTHGVELNKFQQPIETQSPLPCPLTGRREQRPDVIPPRPWIVYWGLIDQRLDPALLGELAHRLSSGDCQASILLVGPQDRPPVGLTQMKNVYILPSIPYEHLPGLARQAAVLIAPYRQLAVTRAMQPLKFLEYLATGRPVVARRLPALEPWSDAADLVDTPAQFAQAVLHRLHCGLSAQQQVARRRLQAETWQVKAELFERWLFAD
ncbi:MAG: glycosyltransferase [Gemmataceae bacterium]|nr:glycosyltransferase [Gemmataceae bacterium]